MSNEAKFGLKEHGSEQVTLDLTKPAVRDLLKRFVNNHETASAYMQIVLLAMNNRRKVTLPCKRCLLETAIQFKDLGAMIEELCDGK